MRDMINAGCKAMVIEASSIGLKHSRLAGMTFDVGIFTNFSDDHIGGVEHKDLAEYLYCKSLLFRQCKFAAANIDDPAWKDITKDFKGSVLTYGFADNADLKGKNAHLLSENGFVGVHFETEGIKNLSVDVDIPGKFNAYNALAAISAVSFFNEIEDQMIIDALKVAKVKGRVERVPVPYNYTLIIDYAHNALSMENVLETLRQYNPHRLITMFGAGGNRPKVRRYEMGETSGRLSDLSVITEDNSRFEDVMDIIEDIKTGLAKPMASMLSCRTAEMQLNIVWTMPRTEILSYLQAKVTRIIRKSRVLSTIWTREKSLPIFSTAKAKPLNI